MYPAGLPGAVRVEVSGALVDGLCGAPGRGISAASPQW